MGTGKPLIAILMAVYEPRMDWLREQLVSLERQSYPNLRLYLRDDCSPTVPFEEIRACVEECIRSFPYKVWQNEKNLGSNRTFERLTREAEGEYFAYCDQDDVWLPEKLTVLQEALEREKALLACSDMYIIDGQGRKVADSITKVRKHHKFSSGEGLSKELLIRNFVTGCTMLVKAREAKMAVPFCPYMVHDHYIALCCAASGGGIYSLKRQLIKYRIHKKNQTGKMVGVTDKESYKRIRIDMPLKKLQWLENFFPWKREFAEVIQLQKAWVEARQKYSSGDREQGATIWKYRKYSPMASIFEIALPYLPNSMFRLAVWANKNNYI